MERFGIVAGRGRFPLLLLQESLRQGYNPPVVALKRVALPAVASCAGAVLWLEVGQVARGVDFLHAHGADQVLLAGGVPRGLLAAKPRLDRHALKLLSAMARGDDYLLGRVARVLEGLGLGVADPAPLLGSQTVSKGHVVGPPLTPIDKTHMDTALRAARTLGAADRGQAAVSCDSGLWTEGIRGTDALLAKVAKKRGQHHCREGVLAKVSKPGQDLRFDMPAIGPQTLGGAARAGLAAVVVEGGTTLVVDRGSCVATAARAGLSVVAV